jgi:hypothetical protein
MSETEIKLWPGVPDLHALGARDFDDLIGASGELEGEERGEVLLESAERSVLRYPLPGTLTRAGERPGRPRGAGTGFVYLTRWQGGSLRDKTAARLSAPRSLSFAARAWNLICHLREHGVGTAQPLAMGEETAALFSTRSFLATRELELMQPLADYLEANRGSTARRRLAHALGLLVARLFEARVELPTLSPETIFVSREGAGEECAAQKIQEVLAPVDKSCGSPVPGLEKRPLPELAIASVHGGCVVESFKERESMDLLRRLGAGVAESWQLDERELLRVAHYAFLRRVPRERRRALVSQLSRSKMAR